LPKGSIVEIERTNEITTKLVARVRYSKDTDLVLVIAPVDVGLFNVITAYLNNKNDKHNTLRLDRISA
jgi:hypothetical protein